MLSRLRLLVVVAVSVLVLVPALWGQPLPTDPRLVTGTLDNGLKYIVRKNDNPPGRASIWLHVNTGSFNETDKQRGLAHFLEHMAFSGSEHFPPGTVIPLFQSLGLVFGADQNAFTSFEQTTFQLSLPDTKPETLDKAILFLSDVASKLTFPQAEIDSQRQVILEERRLRLSGRQRIQDYWLEHVAPGSLLGVRLPIGTEESLKGITQQDLKDYYGKWYVPTNMTVMVVADADPAAIAQRIRESFNFGKRIEPPAAQSPGIKPYETTRAIVASDAEINDAQVGVLWIGPAEPPATTAPLARRDLVDGLATWIFDRRLEQKVSEGKVAFQRAGASAENLFHAAHLATVSAAGEPDKWREMLSDLATELQRARLNGFTEQELADAKKEQQAAAEHAAETDPTRNSGAILNMWNQAITDEEPIMSAQQDLELTRQLLPTITLAEVSQRFSVLFDTSRPMTFSLTLPSGQTPTEEELIAAGRKALDVKPEAEAQGARATQLLTKPPAPGKVAEESEDAASGVYSAWLENGVRVHHRFMDYKKDHVIIQITLAGGEIQETAADRGIAQAAGLVWNQPATASLSSTAIRDYMTGKKAGVTGRAGIDEMMLTVAGAPADLEPAMQVAHLMLTAPAIEKAAFDQWQVRQRINVGMRQKDVTGAFTELLLTTIFGKDEVRLQPLEIPQIDALTQEKAQAWLDKLIASAPIEVAVVGDIQRGPAMELVKEYLGSLPARPRISPALFEPLRHVARQAGPLNGRRMFKTKTDKAPTLYGFFGADAKDLRDVRLLNLAAQVLTSRATTDVREKRNLAYAPSVNSSPASEFPGTGVFFAMSPAAPAKVDALIDAFKGMFDDFAAKGPTAEEVDTVHKQMASTMDARMREPVFWVSAIGNLDYRDKKLADIIAAPQQYQSFTGDEMREAFARYYKPAATFTVVVVAEPPAPRKVDDASMTGTPGAPAAPTGPAPAPSGDPTKPAPPKPAPAAAPK